MRTNIENDKDFIADQKAFRKLRKVLRQIEHLQILPRPLNEEEKEKVSKRTTYRDQLNALNSKYKNGELSLLGTSFSTETTIESSINDSETKVPEDDESQDIQTESFEKPEDDSFNRNLDNITSQIENIDLDKQQESPKAAKEVEKSVEKISPAQEAIVPTESMQKPPKKKVPPPKPKIAYDTVDLVDCHQDLIVSIDVCTESNIIMTASRDTTLKVWNLNDLSLIHSFGGHTSSITQVKFWSYENFERLIKYVKETNNEDDQDYDDLLDIYAENLESGDKMPFILSSSLDCSLRLWSISKR